MAMKTGEATLGWSNRQGFNLRRREILEPLAPISLIHSFIKKMVVPKVPMKTGPLNNRNVQGGFHDDAVGFSISSP